MGDFDQPCAACREGQHEQCTEGTCGCIAPHAVDDPMMWAFKHMKRALHPEREMWTKGGWR